MPGVRVDGNDILAVYAATKEAVDRARAGGGPTLIEALTFRAGPHSSSDDPTRYRPHELVEDWEKKEPIERFRRFLAKRELWTKEFEKEAVETARERISAAVKAAEEAGPPPVESLFDDVYATPTAELSIQRQGLVSLAAKGELTGKDEGYFPL
jgi:pyruvate dehydrogenase E1 component alpha subunit